MEYEIFLQKVQDRAGLTGPDEADRVARATVEALGELLVDHDRRRLAEHLPDPLARALRDGEPGQDFELDDFYARVQRREGVTLGFGVEHAQAVCQALTEVLGDEMTIYLVRRLPADFEPLFERRRVPTTPPVAPHGPRSMPGLGRTLATGRPGGTRPIAEYRRAGQAGSIVESPDPHAETKLSEARGLSSERAEHTIARGRPGSEHPVSDTRD